MAAPSILAFDTSAAHCAAAVFSAGALQHSTFEVMAKGQAERILGMCEEVLTQAALPLSNLTAIAVGVGPGNFTGIRISVSAARGLALGLGIPTLPVSTFEMLRGADAPNDAGRELVIVEAARGAAYVQPFFNGRPTATPEMIDPMTPPAHLFTSDQTVTGHMAKTLAGRLGGTPNPRNIDDPAGSIARIAAWKLQNGFDVALPAAPLYVRAADAAPARDTPPRIVP